MKFINTIIWRCTVCGHDVKYEKYNLKCNDCQHKYDITNNVVRCLDSKKYVTEDVNSKLRNFFKKWPKFYYFVFYFFGPILFSGLSAEDFVDKFCKDNLVINLGSGPSDLPGKVVNIDLFPFKNVSIVADITNLPIKTGTVSGVILDNVIEHVEKPDLVIQEISRILESGGIAYFAFPFLYPFHSSPSDYTRWTYSGFLNKLVEFEILESGVRGGPFSALNTYFCYLFALIFSFGNERLYWLLVNLSIFIFWPIKLFDIIFGKLKFSKDTAAVLYFVARKK